MKPLLAATILKPPLATTILKPLLATRNPSLKQEIPIRSVQKIPTHSMRNNSETLAYEQSKKLVSHEHTKKGP